MNLNAHKTIVVYVELGISLIALSKKTHLDNYFTRCRLICWCGNLLKETRGRCLKNFTRDCGNRSNGTRTSNQRHDRWPRNTIPAFLPIQ